MSLVNKYTNIVGVDHRKKLGQFFTPLEVALFMCKWVTYNKPIEVYDPAFGLGVFFEAALSSNPTISFTASEIDATIIEFYSKNNSHRSTLNIRHEDYLSTWNKRHSAIVCNPPYIKFQLFKNRETILASFAQRLGYSFSGYTNTASAFLVKSLSELLPNGRLAYIMPLEFLNTGYGEHVKARLLDKGLLKSIIKITAEKDVFSEVTTSVGIILAENDNLDSPVNFYTVSKLNDLSSLLETEPTQKIPRSSLDPSVKWLKYFDSKLTNFNTSSLVPINTYGTFSRGIATGANKFFVLSKTDAEHFKISRSSFIRGVTKNTQISKKVFTENDLNDLELNDEPILLLNIDGATISATERNYLKYGESQNIHNRYSTKARTPWYKLEKRNPAPILFGVFSRDNFKIIRNLSSAVNLTCYHGFYPHTFSKGMIDPLFVYFQTRAAKKLLELNMRQYGNSLNKLEPSDLNNTLAPSIDWFAALPNNTLSIAYESCSKNLGIPSFIEALFDDLILDT